MPFYEREDLILDALREKEAMTIRELSAKLYVSVPTLRRDLIKLEEKGLLIRTHGGARLVKKAEDRKDPFFLREQEQNTAKSVMGHMATDYIQNGQIIMLDDSTSAYNIIPYLAGFQNLIVITNSAESSFLLGKMGITNICTGGRMVLGSLSYVGPDAERTVRSYNADILFFACQGLSIDGRLTDTSVEENNVRRAMMEQSRKRVCLCDSSKVGKTYLHNLCHLSQVDAIISETPLPRELTQMLAKEK